MSEIRPTPTRVLAGCKAILANVPTASNPFNLDSETLQRIGEARLALASAAEAQRLSAAEFRSKIVEKGATLDAALQALRSATRVALASGATSAQLAEIGMARPARPVRPLSIPAPNGLVASIVSPTHAKLVWGRGGASYGATFQVFVAPDGLNWRMVATTTKASIVLELPAGQVAWYKVRAARSGLLSPFSNVATLYEANAAARAQRRVA